MLACQAVEDKLVLGDVVDVGRHELAYSSDSHVKFVGGWQLNDICVRFKKIGLERLVNGVRLRADVRKNFALLHKATVRCPRAVQVGVVFGVSVLFCFGSSCRNPTLIGFCLMINLRSSRESMNVTLLVGEIDVSHVVLTK